ncbi:hypothetical protein J437_LFUL012747 [Ladona fulva]|uniref:Uncharacterized protein n=1 Tax=Ladona fulva TaxID=123851 RepID=A0A8K0KPQ1_LADFU|nr:hypothetical protein J437_LFUL012747 [Ladona fulva]
MVTVEKEVLKERLEEYDPNKINIAFKWGCDGAWGHSQYMQGFENSDNDDFYRKLEVDIPKSCAAINEVLPTYKDCLSYGNTKLHQAAISTKIDIERIHYSLKSIFSLTMIDGKTCSNNTAAQNCHICGASPKIMNDLDT